MERFPTAKVERENWRQKFLTKAFTIREVLKWKYNYFESVPYEHRDYRKSVQKFKVYTKSFRFKQLWREKMDEMFYEEAKQKIKALAEQEIHNTTNFESLNFDPARLLVNYDREILSMIHNLREEYLGYSRNPTTYPSYEKEKQNFVIQTLGFYSDLIDYKFENDERFKKYWIDRIATLCDMQVIRQKRLIRENWRKLLPQYHDTSKKAAGAEELQDLLMSDDNGGA